MFISGSNPSSYESIQALILPKVQTFEQNVRKKREQKMNNMAASNNPKNSPTHRSGRSIRNLMNMNTPAVKTNAVTTINANSNDNKVDVNASNNALVDHAYQYYLSVFVPGLGNDDGWGNIGDSFEKIIANIAELIDLNLAKLSEIKRKKK